MGRAPCCDKANVKKGPWSPEEDSQLKQFIQTYGTGGNWISLPQKAGLKRCGKSCRLRWLNYLRPNIKHGEFSAEEDRIIYSLFATIGSRWSIIAGQLPGRTDNDIKNYWNTKLKKKLLMGMVSSSVPNSSTNYSNTDHDHDHDPEIIIKKSESLSQVIISHQNATFDDHQLQPLNYDSNNNNILNYPTGNEKQYYYNNNNNNELEAASALSISSSSTASSNIPLFNCCNYYNLNSSGCLVTNPFDEMGFEFAATTTTTASLIPSSSNNNAINYYMDYI